MPMRGPHEKGCKKEEPIDKSWSEIWLKTPLEILSFLFMWETYFNILELFKIFKKPLHISICLKLSEFVGIKF